MEVGPRGVEQGGAGVGEENINASTSTSRAPPLLRGSPGAGAPSSASSSSSARPPAISTEVEDDSVSCFWTPTGRGGSSVTNAAGAAGSMFSITRNSAALTTTSVTPTTAASSTGIFARTPQAPRASGAACSSSTSASTGIRAEHTLRATKSSPVLLQREERPRIDNDSAQSSSVVRDLDLEEVDINTSSDDEDSENPLFASSSSVFIPDKELKSLAKNPLLSVSFSAFNRDTGEAEIVPDGGTGSSRGSGRVVRSVRREDR
ncbi:unnamed protein product [Amoebophrya sp. A120]|nr:unnamed protein product [Amoebophrya sp. A120]|eukprot:GSA120T00024641001.1